MKSKSDKQEEGNPPPLPTQKKKVAKQLLTHHFFFLSAELRPLLCMKCNRTTCECENYSAQPNEMHGWWGVGQQIDPTSWRALLLISSEALVRPVKVIICIKHAELFCRAEVMCERGFGWKCQKLILVIGEPFLKVFSRVFMAARIDCNMINIHNSPRKRDPSHFNADILHLIQMYC